MKRRSEDFLKAEENAKPIKTENKIELLSCNLEKLKCTKHLQIINKNYNNAELFRCEKNYAKSIKSLKKAYLKASELNNESTCERCVNLFQNTIRDSLKNLNLELHKLTHGIFKKERLKPCYIESCRALKETKKYHIN